MTTQNRIIFAMGALIIVGVAIYGWNSPDSQSSSNAGAAAQTETPANPAVTLANISVWWTRGEGSDEGYFGEAASMDVTNSGTIATSYNVEVRLINAAGVIVATAANGGTDTLSPGQTQNVSLDCGCGFEETIGMMEGSDKMPAGWTYQIYIQDIGDGGSNQLATSGKMPASY